LIKEKGLRREKKKKKKKKHQGMQGGSRKRYNRSEFRTKQQGTLWCAAGAKQVLELVFLFTSMHLLDCCIWFHLLL